MTAATRELLEQALHPVGDSPEEYDSVLKAVGTAELVMLGGSTHGTSDFYMHRAEITKRLIVECGFSAVAIEADWPDAYRVHRFINQSGTDRDATESLGDFIRFPTWMWRNREMVDFIRWLERLNSSRAAMDRVGFYGLDLYSLYSSMAAVLGYLDRASPAQAEAARRCYSQFPGFGGGAQSYGFAALSTVAPRHRKDAITELLQLRHGWYESTREHGLLSQDAQFCAEQNARVVADAEEYYRRIFTTVEDGWNLREGHMFRTLMELFEHLKGSRSHPAKIVLWAHNVHVGDATATERANRGETSLGTLARSAFGAKAKRIGFTTSTGTVTAALCWNGEARMQALKVPLANSTEEILSSVNVPEFFLPLTADRAVTALFSTERPQRVIGVVYDPDIERKESYLRTRLAEQFDGIIHVDYSHAVIPLDSEARATRELPETFPSGI
jgi:erythromycin esterase-like protein